jgi:hypothetical protein
MEIPVHGNEKELHDLLSQTGAVEINVVDNAH